MQVLAVCQSLAEEAADLSSQLGVPPVLCCCFCMHWTAAMSFQVSQCFWWHVAWDKVVRKCTISVDEGESSGQGKERGIYALAILLNMFVMPGPMHTVFEELNPA
jgi:hypothetical protein